MKLIFKPVALLDMPGYCQHGCLLVRHICDKKTCTKILCAGSKVLFEVIACWVIFHAFFVVSGDFFSKHS